MVNLSSKCLLPSVPIMCLAQRLWRHTDVRDVATVFQETKCIKFMRLGVIWRQGGCLILFILDLTLQKKKMLPEWMYQIAWRDTRRGYLCWGLRNGFTELF